MGIRKIDFIFILEEIVKRDLNKGRTLILGYQDIYFGNEYASSVFEKFDIYGTKVKNTINPNFKKNKYCDCKSLFYNLGFETVDILDASDYEGANIIFDMNNEAKKDLFESYDFIFDWGTIEHVYNTKQYLKNILFFLKNGGHYLCLAPASGFLEHGYYQFSPVFFYDYFRRNNWKIISNYILNIKNLLTPQETWNLFEYKMGSLDVYAMGGIDSSTYQTYNLVRKNISTQSEANMQQTQFFNIWNKDHKEKKIEDKIEDKKESKYIFYIFKHYFNFMKFSFYISIQKENISIFNDFSTKIKNIFFDKKNILSDKENFFIEKLNTNKIVYKIISNKIYYNK